MGTPVDHQPISPLSQAAKIRVQFKPVTLTKPIELSEAVAEARAIYEPLPER